MRIFLLLMLAAMVTMALYLGAPRDNSVQTDFRPDSAPGETIVPDLPLGNTAQDLLKELQKNEDDRLIMMRSIVNKELLPVLYASNDQDALIAGFVLSVTNQFAENESYYTANDFLELALSLNPDDPLLLSLATLYCRNYQDLHDYSVLRNEWLGSSYDHENLLCADISFLQRLSDLTGDNSWVWIMRAVAEEDNPLLRWDYLSRAGNATYYNDYGVETSRLMMDTLQRYGTEIEDEELLLLYGISQSNYLGVGKYGWGSLCNRGVREGREEYVLACGSIARFVQDSDTILGQMMSAALLHQIQGVSGQLDKRADEFLKFYEEKYLEFVNLLSNNSDARKYNERAMTRYIEIDATMQTLIHYGLMKDDGVAPVEIRNLSTNN